MAQIDLEMQRRLYALVSEFGAACHRMCNAATLAKFEILELAVAMDEDLTASLEDAATAAIQAARGKPPNV